MKLSTRTRYGIRAISELAMRHGKGPTQIKAIAECQGISIKYLEQLMAMLKSGGFVRSIRGSKGGYLLARPPGKIYLDEVFFALEGPVATTECVDDKSYCPKSADCATRQVWVDVQKAITKVLHKITLDDMVKKRTGKKHDYQI